MRIGKWLLLAAAILLGVFLNLNALVALCVAVLFIIGVAWLWQHYALRNVTYHRRFHYRRGFPGEASQVSIQIANLKVLPVTWLRSMDLWARAVRPTDDSVLTPSHMPDVDYLSNLFSLRPRQRITRNYDLVFEKRGVYPIGPVELKSGDPFGFFETTSEIAQSETLVVFPQLLPFETIGLPAEDPFGDKASMRQLFEDPTRTMAVRDYRPTDEFRHIHWAATARTGELQVRVYQPISARVLVICLNAATTELAWQGVKTDLLEYLLSLSATLAYQGIQSGYSVGLVSNGSLSRSGQPFQIQPARSTEHLANLLQALSGISPLMAGPFETYLLKAMPRIPMGAALMIVTAIYTPTLAAAITQLRRYRPHLTLLSLDPHTPDNIPGIRVIRLAMPESK
jgi:uncharacterized protein (DUF58 family)